MCHSCAHRKLHRIPGSNLKTMKQYLSSRIKGFSNFFSKMHLKWQCDDGECILDWWLCDDIVDCEDGSDEPGTIEDCPPCKEDEVFVDL